MIIAVFLTLQIIQPIVLVRQHRGGFLLFLHKVKDTHAIYLHECLSTIINMVLSVQVYYYSNKNIANFKR